jgi:hypothetical protein
MKKEEIKNIMVIFSDNDFIRVFDWIGKVSLMTIKNNNICGCTVLEESNDIENFIKSLISTGIEFLQYREDKYADYCRYENVTKEVVDRLTEGFNDIYFIYNFDENFNGEGGGCESLIIDLDNNESYIR